MGFYYRSFLKNRGFPQDQFEGRPVIGICNTWSELTPATRISATIAEHVRCGVLEAGGFPLEFPVMLARRDDDAADRDAVPQPRGDGRRGVDPRQPARRRGAADGLRQDHARAADGRGERRPADRSASPADRMLARRLPRAG